MNFQEYFNPEVTDLDFHITIPVTAAYDNGWDFTEYVEHEREEGETYSDALNRFLSSDWQMCVTIRGKKEDPSTTFCFVDTDGLHQHSQWTGDNEKTIQDVIQWLSDGFDDVRDFSWESDGDTYQPAFSQFKTQE